MSRVLLNFQNGKEEQAFTCIQQPHAFLGSIFNHSLPASLTLYSTDTQQQMAFEDIVEKEEIARNEQLLLFPIMFSTQTGNSVPI